MKNQAKNPFYLINYTLAGDDFGEAVEALEKNNVVMMTLKSTYQVMMFIQWIFDGKQWRTQIFFEGGA